MADIPGFESIANMAGLPTTIEELEEWIKKDENNLKKFESF